MTTQIITIESELEPAAAFDRMIDLTRVPEWDRGVASSTLVAGEAGIVGARYEVEVTGFDGQPTTVDYELTAVGDLTFTMVGTHATFRAEDTITVERTDTGSRVLYDAGLVLAGDPPPLDDAQFAGLFTHLVSVVESGLGSYLSA